MKAIALIDGEHYIPVNKSALQQLRDERGYDFLAAVFIGGWEKIGTSQDLKQLGLPIIIEKNPLEGITKALEEYKPQVVVDLSDEPVVGYIERFQFANLILSKNVIYEGADFCFTPPLYLDIAKKPSMAVGGTGKRVGKTAVGAYTGRVLSGQEGRRDINYFPCIVTMGRGGPPQPEVIEGDKIEMTPQYFLKMSSMGKHAASDHFEDALLARLTTIGCRRCGGGMAGVVFTSIVPKGVEVANELPCKFIILEGSGASLPPVKSDAWMMVVGAHQPLQYISSYMGPYRIMMSDLIVLTMCEEPMASKEKVEEMDKLLRHINPKAKVVHTVFRPKPLESLKGKNVLYTTTAPPSVGKIIVEYLEEHYKCNVLAVSHHLSHRPKLREDIEKALSEFPQINVLLTEVKAASIDVATKLGVENGLDVVYMDNIPVTVGGDGELEELIIELAEKASQRFARRKIGE